MSEAVVEAYRLKASFGQRLLSRLRPSISVGKAAGLILLCGLPAFAAAEESTRLPALPEGVAIVDQRDLADVEKRYPKGSVRRIGGTLRYENEVLRHGAWQGITYQLPAEHGALDVFTAVRTALMEEGGRLLYWCAGLDCGSSSLWANQVFEQARLYGPDNAQAYALLQTGERQILALYAITRGNRRSYLHAEWLQASEGVDEVLPTASTLLKVLRADGRLDVDRDTPNEDWSQLLSRMMNLDSTLRVGLSGQQARAWAQALEAKGVRASRLEADDTGQSSALQIKLLR